MLPFIISSLCLLFLSITMLVRGNDHGIQQGWRSWVRLVGFVVVGVSPVGIAGAEWVTKNWPSWFEVMFRFGLVCIFLTTPRLPPWWRYIAGKEQAREG